MSKEKSPQDWNTVERFEAIVHCHHLTDDQASAYCREQGIYLHHLNTWKAEFLSESKSTESVYKQAQTKLKQENKRLHKELNRKEKALSETAALLVLSKSAKRSGGKGGRLIAYSDRQHYSALIDEAVDNGARQKLACELVGISARTYQRWNRGEGLSEDLRLHNTAPVHNQLSEAIKQEIITVINKPEYSALTPHQIVPRLLDLGCYLASESTFYRVMKAHNQLKHRAKGAAGQHNKPQSLKATQANQIYSWDITYLLSPVKGQYFYLYMVMDIYSRKIVGWQVHDAESSAHAADLIEDIARRENIDKKQLVIHSDNGSPMKGATLRAKLVDLDIATSFSRPRVSNDNPYSESLFKTVKYHHTFPENPFKTLSEARNWVEAFVCWFNNEHQHSALKFVTPNQRHNGLDSAVLEKRKRVIEQAKRDNPERWNGRQTRNLTPIGHVYLNPDKENFNTTECQAA
ncbi:IS3 family transposase [methane-oxidizing endosymbiont of Gigantopelta aegis]